MPTEFELYMQQLRQDQGIEDDDNFLYSPNNVSRGEIEGYDSLVVEPIEQKENFEITPAESTGKKFTLGELRNDKEFDMRSARFLNGIEANDDIFEYLRDADYSLSSAISRSFQSGKWTDEQKEDYVYLKDKFDNAEIDSFKERFQAFTNITGDIILDPLNIVPALFAIPSGGTSLGLRGSLGVAGQQAIKRQIKSKVGETAVKETGKAITRKQAAKEVAIFSGAEGMAWGGLHNYFMQDIDIDLGLSEDFDLTQLGASTLLGGVAGAAFGGGLKYATYKGAKKPITSSGNKDIDDVPVTEMPEPQQQMEFKFSNEDIIIDSTKDKNLRQRVLENFNIDSKINSLSTFTKAKGKAIASTIGKPTTKFLAYVDNSPKLKELLARVRYDFDSTMASKGEFLVKAKSFGLAVGERTGLYNFGLTEALGVLGKTGIRARLTDKDNIELITLLRDKNVVSKPTSDKSKKFIGDMVRDGEVTAEMGFAYGGRINKAGEVVYDGKGGVRNLLDDTFQDIKAQDLFKINTENLGGYMPRLFNYSKLKKAENRKLFQEKLIESGHADPINDKDFLTIVIEDGTKVKGIKEDALGVDEEVFGMDFLELAKGDMVKARQLKAQKIVDDMLEERWTPFEIKMAKQESTTGQRGSHLQARRFTNLKDNEISFVLENDVQTILESYFSNAARSVERAKFFGRTEIEMFNNYVKPIREELTASGVSDGESKQVADEVFDMMRRITGIETDRSSIFKKYDSLRHFADGMKVIQQVAHLPLATLSSLTEPLLLLSRAGKGDGVNVGKDIMNALSKEGSDIMFRTIKGIRRAKGDTISDVADESLLGKTFKSSIRDDEWAELYRTGLALEQAVQERLEGLAGEGLHSNAAKLAQQGFFKVNLLTQWTKAVQLAAYTTGKRLIRQRAKALYEHQKGLSPIMLTGQGKTSSTKYYIQQLNDLGVDEFDAIQWYKSSLDKTGKFNENLSKGLDNSGNLIKQKGQKGFGNDHFYKYSYTSGANRFTKEIILNPSTAEANRPLWFSTPSAQLLVQFAGYPTVFNNTILKRFSNELINNPVQATPKILTTVLLMTGIAHVGNTIRSNGNNLRDYETNLQKSEGELLGEAVRRWGGYGPYDYASRYGNESERNVGGTTALLKTAAGPLPQDLIDAVLYRKGLLEIGVTNAPGYAAYDLILGEGTKKSFKSWARGSDKADERKSPVLKYASGGLVYNVDNVHPEPDEVKMRGVDATYNEVAGVVLRDEEDRLFASEGGTIKDQMNRLGFASGTDEFGRPSVKTKQEDFYIPETEDYPEGPEDEGLRNVFIAPDVLGLVGVRAAKVASGVVEEGLSQVVTKAKYPKQVTHGGFPNLKKITNSFDRYYKETGYKNPNLQAGVFAARDKGGHAQYTKAPGRQGYDLDTASVSSVKNIVSKKGKVLNFTKPPKSLNKVFDKAIANKKELAKTAESNRVQRKFNKEASELERFQRMLFDKNTKGVGKMPESIRNVLVKEGYDIVSQPTYRYGVLNSPVGSEILLKEFPIK